MHSTDTPITQEQHEALAAARELVYAGVPVFRATPCPPGCHDDPRDGWHRPRGWESTPAYDLTGVEAWRPGDALCAVMGHTLDLIDVDTRAGGDESAAVITAAGAMPYLYASASTPSGGAHYFVAAMHVGSRDDVRPGIDIKGGRPDGTGRGYAFIAPTVAASKVDGQPRAYRWTRAPDSDMIRDEVARDDTGVALAEIVSAALGPRPVPKLSGTGVTSRFATHREWWTYDEARAECERIVGEFASQGYAGHGYNARLNELAYRVGHFVGGGFIDHDDAVAWLHSAAGACGMLAAPPGYTYIPDGERKVLGTIRSGLAAGTREPYAWYEERDPGKDVGTADPVPDDARLDWATEFARDHDAVTWLPGKLGQRGDQIALVGEGKAGKSLFMLDWCWHAVTGRKFLDTEVTETLTVLYVDRENSARDLVARLRAFGATPGELTELVYLSFPTLGALDTECAAELLAAVDRYGAEVVVLDTVSRFVEGKENDSDTWLALYRNVHAELKARGVTGIRLDHFGKDTDRGSRGSSAKSQDIDHVWELSKLADDPSGDATRVTKLRLTRTHTRSGLGPDMIDIDRVAVMEGDAWADGQTNHRLSTEGARVWGGIIVTKVAAELDAAGVSRTLGRDRLKVEGARLGIRVSNDTWADVTRYRKAQGMVLRTPLLGESADPDDE